MSDVAISVENLSKAYRIGLNEKRPDTLVESMFSLLKAPIRNFRNLRKLTSFDLEKEEEDVIWALKDVSFEVKQGEVVGIIGRNGAGKSTLLKILSRITEPTSGRAVVYGRVGSLLEVGTGFHPELTGRENIYMNGTILGMTKKEIDQKFDEIVEFAGIGKFLDTPVKKYSSGMTVRLAFAVAAHLDPEILIVDEVLAVGDAEFQKKCLGKMESISKAEGKTVLFVSHNMDSVSRLCKTCLILESGKICKKDTAENAVQYYISQMLPHIKLNNGYWVNDASEVGVKRVQVTQFGKPTDYIICGQPFKINIEVRLDESCNNLEIGFGLIDEDGRDIIRLNNKHLNQSINWTEKMTSPIEITIPFLNWIHGEFIYLGIYFGYIGKQYQELHSIIKLGLIKKFKEGTIENIVKRVNTIYIEGIKFE